MRKLALSVTPLLMAALFFAQPQPAHAIAVGAAICTVAVYPCPAGFTTDSGIRVAGPAVLPFNSWALLNFNFQDGLMSFTGSVLAVNRRVGNINAIYEWGTGVATNDGGSDFGWLDVAITQTFQTLPGFWQFSEINIGSCNNGAVLNSNINGAVGPGSASGSSVQGVVNGAGLPVLNASCGGQNPWNLGAGPFQGVNITTSTNLTSLGQFFFNAGLNPGLNQAISLPWGDDFPDPSFYNGAFPTIDQLINDPTMTSVTPEPGTCALFGAALIGLAAIRRRRR